MRYMIEVSTEPDSFHDLTEKIQKIVEASRAENGLCMIFCQHTTCGLVIQENDKPLLDDFRNAMDRIAPFSEAYHHEENAPSHIRASIMGCEKTIPVSNGRLELGEWQSILLYECDVKQRKRKVIVRII